MSSQQLCLSTQDLPKISTDGECAHQTPTPGRDANAAGGELVFFLGETLGSLSTLWWAALNEQECKQHELGSRSCIYERIQRWDKAKNGEILL